MASKKSITERKISLGRGGAGNLRRPSEISSAWSALKENRQDPEQSASRRSSSTSNNSQSSKRRSSLRLFSPRSNDS
ncbi:Hypothetical protein D9617_38g091200 [Elsinoe fawcettii]|nr:Hypothetical protein D9617_38g091200 [Elsinoe fawcettii]